MSPLLVVPPQRQRPVVGAPGWPRRLEYVLSVYRISENALARARPATGRVNKDLIIWSKIVCNQSALPNHLAATGRPPTSEAISLPVSSTATRFAGWPTA